MSTRAFLLAAGLLTASFAPALSDSVTATVKSWDEANRTLTLEDFSKFMDIPGTVAMQGLKGGEEVTVEYDGSENGIETITRVEITKEYARRRLQPSQQRG